MKGSSFFKDKGTGLGLYQIKIAVEAMNGELTIKNIEPSGLFVEIKLPRVHKEKV